MIVKFKKTYVPYYENDVAGFEEDFAKKLIQDGFAEEIKKEEKKPVLKGK